MTATTLGQSAFDNLVEDAIQEVFNDSEFSIHYHFNEDWISRNLPDFYLDGWEELSDEHKHEVVVDVREQVTMSLSSDC